MENKFEKAQSVLPEGIKGDGLTDDAPAIQALLDTMAGEVYFPKPKEAYLIGRTLKIHSGQTLRLDRNAVVRLADHAGVHMLTNGDHKAGNRGITVIGGIWDGNNLSQTCEYHQTRNGNVPFDPDRYLGGQRLYGCAPSFGRLPDPPDKNLQRLRNLPF